MPSGPLDLAWALPYFILKTGGSCDILYLYHQSRCGRRGGRQHQVTSEPKTTCCFSSPHSFGSSFWTLIELLEISLFQITEMFRDWLLASSLVLSLCLDSAIGAAVSMPISVLTTTPVQIPTTTANSILVAPTLDAQAQLSQLALLKPVAAPSTIPRESQHQFNAKYLTYPQRQRLSLAP